MDEGGPTTADVDARMKKLGIKGFDATGVMSPEEEMRCLDEFEAIRGLRETEAIRQIVQRPPSAD